MAYTLSTLISDTLLRLGRLNISTATGGSASTAVDSSLIGLYSDDDWNGGYCFVLYTTDGLAPLGQYQKISDYTNSTGTFSTGTFTAAIGAGDRFGFAVANEYPVDTLIHLANLALTSLGDIALVDTTTLDTASLQTEYACSVEWKRNKPYRVDVATNDDTNDNQWNPVNFEYVPAAPGSAGLIVFNAELDSGDHIRVWYDGSHPELTAYNSTVSETIPPELARAILFEKVLEWKNLQVTGTDQFLLKVWEKAQQDLNYARAAHKIWKPRRDNNHIKMGNI